MNLASFSWISYIVLSGFGLAALGLALPFSTKPIRWLIATAILLALIGFGLGIASLDGIQASALASWSSGKLISSRIMITIGLGFMIGAAIGIILLAILYLLSRRALPQLRIRFTDEAKFPLWKRLAIAFYSGILEEIIFRLFLLSVMAWLIGLLWHTAGGKPTYGALWISNFVAALIFGLVHLPRWSSLTRLTPILILVLISMNGLAGLAFGYLFFTYGIEAAIIAHFIGDSLLHIIGPGILGT